MGRDHNTSYPSPMSFSVELTVMNEVEDAANTSGNSDSLMPPIEDEGASSLKKMMATINSTATEVQGLKASIQMLQSEGSTMATHQRAFHSEVRNALDNISKALEYLNQGLSVKAEPKGPLQRVDKPAKRRDLPY